MAKSYCSVVSFNINVHSYLCLNWHICLYWYFWVWNHTHNRLLFCKNERRAIICAKKNQYIESWNCSVVTLDMNMYSSYLCLGTKDNTGTWKYGIVLTRSYCLGVGKNSDNGHKQRAVKWGKHTVVRFWCELVVILVPWHACLYWYLWV